MRVHHTILALVAAVLMMAVPSALPAQTVITPAFIPARSVTPMTFFGDQLLQFRLAGTSPFAPLARQLYLSGAFFYPYVPSYYYPPVYFDSGYGYSVAPYSTGSYQRSYRAYDYSADRYMRLGPYQKANSDSYGAGGAYTSARSYLPAQTVAVVNVNVRDESFSPAQINVPAGTTVRWSNSGAKPHTITSDDGEWTSKELKSGDTYTFTFSRPGTYPYHCRLHPHEMRGEVTVR